MLKYVVRINLNKEKYAEWLKNGKDYDKHNPIKGWDGVNSTIRCWKVLLPSFNNEA